MIAVGALTGCESMLVLSIALQAFEMATLHSQLGAFDIRFDRRKYLSLTQVHGVEVHGHQVGVELTLRSETHGALTPTKVHGESETADRNGQPPGVDVCASTSRHLEIREGGDVHEVVFVHECPPFQRCCNRALVACELSHLTWRMWFCGSLG